MPAEPAPGQAAYEAYASTVPEELFPESLRGMTWTPWDKLPTGEQQAYAAAAAAVAAPLNAEIASLRGQLAEVRRIAYQGGQDAASVRRELLAYLEANGGREALEGGTHG